MSNYQHGHNPHNDPSPTYRSWRAMLNRCDNPNSDRYEFYGGRGITYDPRWRDFKAFLADMGERPEGMTIDRINGNLGYFKDNCRWATKREQSINSRGTKLTPEKVKTILLTYSIKSPSEPLKVWARSIAPVYGVSPETIRAIIHGRLWQDVS